MEGEKACGRSSHGEAPDPRSDLADLHGRRLRRCLARLGRGGSNGAVVLENGMGGVNGGQGALYDDKGLHYFKECTINGGVDAIFGFGRSFYDGCRAVVSKPAATATVPTAPPQRAAKNKAAAEEANTVDSGFAFYNGTIKAGGATPGDKVYLGRAWDDSSFVVYFTTKMANEVVPIGYECWSIQKPADGGVYYGVYKRSGPGLDASKKMGWAKELDDGQAFAYEFIDFVEGATWILPQPAPPD
ncbi:hypothetical protein E2562_019694 [Oryza meyeriana var. granulata]|uniref:pectinesterase n=1 Tax=Oryza meyeriana var. granulata TaxID=110450 RepID=A0A6G1C6W3_9ORYZ|nr:hypothetical protein E2562_019694 [Oryza meyeriana var. granulata]